jgi:hypothetical protein
MSLPYSIEIYNSTRGFNSECRDVIACGRRRQQRGQGTNVVAGGIGGNAQAMLKSVPRRPTLPYD